MAELVGVIGVTHNPLVWSLMSNSTPPDLEGVASNFERLREQVVKAAPDVIVLVGSDHFHMLFTNNMPSFMIGKAPRMRAVFPNEVRSFGLTPSTVPGDHEFATDLLGRSGPGGGFDFSFSDEPWLDHAFVIPLLSLDPGLEIPVVPIFTNTTAPPLPTAQRFADLGMYLRAAIEASTLDRRVLLVGSGHLAHELGGPRQFIGVSPDPHFDDAAIGWMRQGDLASALEQCSFDRLGRSGNETFQFLNFITCLAAAGTPADMAEATSTRFGNLPFLAWSNL